MGSFEHPLILNKTTSEKNLNRSKTPHADPIPANKSGSDQIQIPNTNLGDISVPVNYTRDNCRSQSTNMFSNPKIENVATFTL
jgi:hypothetical protein